MVAAENKAKSIFLSAVELPSEFDRQAYVAENCAGDAALYREVEDLLHHFSGMGQFLESPADGSSPISANPPIAECPGTVIGSYKLLEPIGEGGFGVVFHAEQQQPVRRKVALKVLKPGMDTRQVVARFEAERQALALMDHPNIARVFDGGETDTGRPFFVMELVRGLPITDFCDQNQLGVRERLALFVHVCQAVQHAHQKGVIHRDIKPTNVLVTLHDGLPVPKVIDFGIAKATSQALTDKTLFTNFAQFIGTPVYMSPEQAELSGLDVDTRSDIYSLGVLLYELLSGTTPFDAARLRSVGYDEIRRIIREEEPAKPSNRMSTVGRTATTASTNRGTDPHRLSALVRGELDWIVMKALEKDRNRRYETANGFAMDVQRYLADEAVLACPPSASYRLRKFARRNRAALVMGSIIAGAMLTTVVALAVSNWRVSEKQLQTNDALEQTKAEKRQKSEQLWHALVAQARANRLSRRSGQRFETLEILRQATDLAHTLDLPEGNFGELRNAVIGALTLPDLYLAGPWIPWPADGYASDFDEAHSLYARTDRQGICSVRRVADDVEIHRLPGLGGLAWPHLSRNGKFLAVGHFAGGPGVRPVVQLWELEPTTARKIWSKENVSFVDFHRNGQQVGMASADGTICLFELPSGRPMGRTLAPKTLSRDVGFALHPTEPVVAVYSYFNSVVQLRDLGTEEVVATLPQDTSPCSVAWSPDGRTLAVGLEAFRIRLYDRATRQVIRTLGTDQAVDRIAYSHAGDCLAATGWGRIAELFDVGTGQKLFASRFASETLRFSRDDQRVAGSIQDGKLGIWQVADGRECRTLVRQAKPENAQLPYSMSVSSDGRLLAAAMTDGFGIWDLASSDELDFIPTKGVACVHFEPSGSLLVLCQTGLFRWPLTEQSRAAGQWVMGPPERLSLPCGNALGQSRDGRVIVSCSRAVDFQKAYAGAWILHADRPNQPIRIDPGADIVHIAVSPDGRWVVTVNHNPAGLVRVWDAHDGKRVKQLAEWGGIGYPRFSPDGNWLSTGLDGGRLFAVGTWEPGPRVGGVGTFAPDSQLLAITTSAGNLRLVVPATGRELATLEDPSQDGSNAPFFTPDGAKLIALSSGKVTGIRVWDLRLIRQQLVTMRLDWDAPPYPPADPVKSLVPLKLEVRRGNPAFEGGVEIEPPPQVKR